MLLITEFMQGGDLRTRIRNDTASPRKTGWYQDGRYIALGIARGLVYLHSRGIIWFDCKPNNILLDYTGSVAKIADFGLSKILTATYTDGCLVSQLLTPLFCTELTEWPAGIYGNQYAKYSDCKFLNALECRQKPLVVTHGVSRYVCLSCLLMASIVL